ncbi:hypothetical protein GCM10023328_04620 [Modestobacter marinus]|uniref:DUF2332 domain-containing protein n=1 Tax=Modestobacter marinus TaxID=477641 RepID=A0A846LNU9_9ACTN|nr:DUF2332 domain-containing protein [Modestobacter marinus]NIH67115.1 hypothetical protein [Modestobacter marinus]GGL52145.1 hypothetical protein GCM10011589_05340 [Modestobacter marinus]
MRSLDEELTDLADHYRWFAEVEAAPVSPRYAELAAAVAEDAEVLAFLGTLPTPKRQANLLLGALQYLHGGPPADGAQLHERVTGDADRLRATMLARATQTNEAARCAALLPVLAGLPGPLALIEVGASAGLCLYPDRYGYEYSDGVRVGPASSPVQLRCTVSGRGPVPASVPQVVRRAGIDLNPLDPADPDDVAWLQALIWPGMDERRDRLAAAAAIAAREPAEIRRGDLVEELPGLAAAMPTEATVVVFHTAVLAYLPATGKEAFTELVAGLPVRWVSQEGVGVLPAVRDRLPEPPDPAETRFLLALDGEPLAYTAAHGGRIDWLPAAAALSR